MDGCTKGPQLEEGENLNTRALGTGRTPPGGTSAPARQAQGGPSLAFVKENIDVLRTMIKELDNRGQEKMSPSAKEVGGYSSDGSSRSRCIGRSRSARKNRNGISKKKGIEMAETKTVEHENKEKDVINDATKPDVEKSAEEEGDAGKAADSNFQVKESTEFPLPSSSLLVSSGFGTQFFNSSSDISLPGVLKDTTEADLRVAKLEKDVSKLKKIDLSAKALAALKIQVPSVVDNYLGSKVGDVFQKELKKHTADLIQKYSRQQIPELPKN
ncbi:hypothetical protein Tco_0922457 [Tanacetum coccineum]|uniref:Uncharacterized protein n=1 Tax=Tanacetum coccineum TaxID=301880 RepID=A0ABQ5D1H0_9ASTR